MAKKQLEKTYDFYLTFFDLISGKYTLANHKNYPDDTKKATDTGISGLHIAVNSGSEQFGREYR